VNTRLKALALVKIGSPNFKRLDAGTGVEFYRRVYHLRRFRRILRSCASPASGSGRLWTAGAVAHHFSLCQEGLCVYTTHEFSSILKFVETRYNLFPLTARDAAASDMFDSFDFQQTPQSLLILQTRGCPKSNIPGSGPDIDKIGRRRVDWMRRSLG